MESQPQNPEFRNNPENLHPCSHVVMIVVEPLYLTEDKVSCYRTKHSVLGESGISNRLIPSLTLYLSATALLSLSNVNLVRQKN